MKISVLLLPSAIALVVMAEAPNLVKMGALLDCGIPCTSNADCAGCTNWCQTTENGGIVSKCPSYFHDLSEKY